MRIKTAALATLILTILLPTALGQDNLTLDLSAPEVIKDLEAMTGVCSGGRTGAVALHHPETFKNPALPLTLEILSLNGAEFRVGDHITAELRLINVGDKDVMLPWNIHSDTVYGPPPGCQWPKTPGATGLRGAFYLDVADPDRRTDINAASELYAISTVPNSYRNLAPGRNAQITISGRIHINFPRPAANTGGSASGAPGAFTVTAVFKLDNSSMRSPFEKLRSINQLSITVTDPSMNSPRK